MGTLYVALNHDRKEAFMLGKSIGRIPVNSTLEELESYFADYHDDAFYRDIARRLFEFGVQEVETDTGDLHELYEDYRYVDSAFESYRDYVGKYVVAEEDWDSNRISNYKNLAVATAPTLIGKIGTMFGINIKGNK